MAKQSAEPSAHAPHRIRCFTRALKNARFLQQAAPATFAKSTRDHAFGTGLPAVVLQRLHLFTHESPEVQPHPELVEFLKKQTVPKPKRMERRQA